VRLLVGKRKEKFFFFPEAGEEKRNRMGDFEDDEYLVSRGGFGERIKSYFRRSNKWQLIMALTLVFLVAITIVLLALLKGMEGLIG
jgi:hypothetical protein